MKIRLKPLFVVIFVLFIVIVFWGKEKITIYTQEKSKIYQFMEEYEANSADFDGIKSQLKKDSPEYLFLLGLEQLENNDLKRSEEYLKSAQKKSLHNTILQSYTNYYLNECYYLENMQGDSNFIKKFLDNLSSSPVLCNDTDLIWNSINTIIYDSKSRKIAIQYLDEYINETKNLSVRNALTLKGNEAMLCLLNKDYSKSVNLFLSIIDESEKIKDVDERNYLRVRTCEYLSNIYTILEEDEKATEFYNIAIHLPISDPEKNAKAKSSFYLNVASSYIEAGNIEGAKEVSNELLKIIDDLPDSMRSGVELFQYNNLALIEMKEKNFKKAERYLERCYSLLEDSNNEQFLYYNLYVALTCIELDIEKGNLDDALKLAEELLKSDTEYDLDFKKSIYSFLLKVYERTEQKDLYIETYKKLKWEEDKLNKEIKKDYIEYIAANYKLGVAHEINERLLVIILIVTFICLITAIVIIILILHNKKVKHDGDLDGLSQVYNRKYLEKDIKRMLERRGISLSIGILILDIDYFKLYNDFYGHPAGDLVIKQVASCLKASVRNEDIIIRYGGEEFLILLKNIDQHMLESICNRIKMELKKMSIPHEKSEVEKVVTVSIGGTIHTICSYEQLLEQIKVADSNLYRAKKNGRNQYQLK